MQKQRHQMDYVLFFTVLILTAVGVLTVYSASTVIALHNTPPLPASYYATKQLYFAVFGVIVMVGISFLSTKFWYKIAVPFLGVSLFLLFLVLIPHIGVSKLGGRRWLGHGSLLIQPSEIAIIATIVYLAFFFTKKIALVHNFKRGLLPGLIVAGLVIGLILMEPDMGTSMTLLTSCIVILFASGARLKPLLILGGALTPVVIGLAFMESYRSARIKSWLDPFHYASDQSYQVLHGFTAIASGGWFGRGFDMSIEKMGYLPIPQIDFIFPIFVEEWGFIGAIALLVTFGVLIWRGFHTARRAPDRFSALLSIGLTGMITFKTIINLGAVTGLLPVTGIPLPFISYGGTSLIMNLVAMGLLLSISRYTLDVEPEEDQLADIISVETVEEFRDRRVEPERPRLRVVSERKSADVRPLPRRDQKTQAVPRDTWRARQETAVTKRDVSRERRTSAPSMTWRERNQTTYRDAPNRNDRKGSKIKSLFRKDR